MRALHIAELRGSWKAWLSVALGFVAVGFALGLTALMMESVILYFADREVDPYTSFGTIGIVVFNLAMCIPVALMVIGSITQLVIASRRPAIARLALAGATPSQIVGTLMTQLVAVSFVATLVGLVLAILVQPAALAWLSGDRSTEGLTGVIGAHVGLSPILLTLALAVLVAVVGGFRQARRATRIPPVEALRAASIPVAPRRPVARWIGVGILTLLTIVIGVGILVAFSRIEQQKGDIIMQVAFILLILMLWAVSLAAPMILGPVTRAWTSLIPTKSPVWHLVRHTIIAKADRLAKTVVPLALAFALPVGMLILGQSFVTVLDRVGGPELGHTGMLTLLILMALPFLIALAGAVCNLIMMSRARDAELALDSLAGATPAQLRWILVGEGVVIFVSSLLLALIPLVAFGVFVRAGIQVAYHLPVLTIPATDSLGVAGVLLAIAVLATVLPSLGSLDDPAPTVVKRLVAD